MGRSVSYPSGSIVAFNQFDFDEFDAQYQYRELMDDFVSVLQSNFSNVTECDTWLDREDHALAENSFAYFGMSEYCGTIAYWIAPKEPYCPYECRDISGLQTRWLKQVSKKFARLFGTLSKMGTMSNGVSVYAFIDGS